MLVYSKRQSFVCMYMSSSAVPMHEIYVYLRREICQAPTLVSSRRSNILL